MQQKTIAVVAALALSAVAALLVIPTLSSEEPMVAWNQDQEVVFQEGELTTAGSEEAQGAAESALDRQQLAAVAGDEPRTDAILRGRVVSVGSVPVADAEVFLEFSRGGPRGDNRQRRVPDPVRTDREGRFAFRGQVYRDLRVVLQVRHRQFAVSRFDRNLPEIGAEVEVGDLMVRVGGEILGRVTDLSGNAVTNATVQLSPEGQNELRFVRNREEMFPPVQVDQNGFYRIAHIGEGDWRIRAEAPKHQRGGSEQFPVNDGLLSEVEDIKLGPGYELSGTVFDPQNKPVAKAEVSLREGRGGNHNTETDEQGRFRLDHLPGTAMTVRVQADGFLDHSQPGVNPAESAPLVVRLQDGLKITGIATDQAGKPVSMFAVRANRVRGIQPERDPQLEARFAELRAQMQAMRDAPAADREQMRARMEQMRAMMEASAQDTQALEQMRRARANEVQGPGRRGRDGAQDQGRGGRNANWQSMDGGGRGGRGGWNGPGLGEPSAHAGGEFTLTGLQEGIYEVAIQSPDHQRWTSGELELRIGSSPHVAATLLRGFSVEGMVRDAQGQPVAGARVELRTIPAELPDRGNEDGGNGRGRGGRRIMTQGAMIVEATAGKDGRYALKNAPAGDYKVHGSARGFQNASSEAIAVAADVKNVALELDALGKLTGTVRGVTPAVASSVRVFTIPVGEQNPMRFRGGGSFGVGVNDEGIYHVDDLAPGTYAVRAFAGNPGELMRELMPKVMDGSLQADVTIAAGELGKLDLNLDLPRTGTLNGEVLANGEPARGFIVQLQLIGGENGEGGRNGGRGGRGPGGPGGRGGPFGGGQLEATVAGSGRYSIRDIPEGSYTLTVMRNRRDGALATENVTIYAQQNEVRNLTVVTSAVEGTVIADGVDVATLRGGVMLLPGVSEMPADMGAWRRENRMFNARLQNGRFRIDSLPPGPYLAVLNVQGRERTSVPIHAGPGTNQLQLTAGAVQAANPANGGANGSGANGNAGNGPGGNPRRNAPQNGGQPGGNEGQPAPRRGGR